jgi:UDP-N-acetylglucosamine 4,6-dehydratase/5-epimerase
MSSYLITGGTGTLGRALVRQMLCDNVSDRICIFSRGEHAQAEMREQLGDNDRLRWFIGDVRSKDRLYRAMTNVDVVIHAAALKRIEVGAYNPIEMIRTNVDGTVNVIESAQDAGVNKVMFISSDKAYNPISPYGQSKALAESLILTANNTVSTSCPKFSACRYGNVWKSNGSVVPRWRAIIAKGGKTVPVTDPDCTRFFMTIDEAVELVLGTVKVMKGGELAIPTLPAYRIGDLAEAMNVGMEIRGLPSYEKKHEGMNSEESSEFARRMTVSELKGWLSKDAMTAKEIIDKIGRLSDELRRMIPASQLKVA